MIISEELQATLDKATELVDWIIARLNGIEIKRDDRHRVPSMLFDLVIEHHISIAQLLKLQLCASAFTLVRCEFESFVRGSWLHYCATDKQLESFVEKDHLTFNFREMIEALEQKPQFAIKYFSTLRDQY